MTQPAKTPGPSTKSTQMKWSGWGDPSKRLGFEDRPSMAAFLSRRLGISGEVVERPVELGSVDVPASRLPAAARKRLVEAVGADGFADDAESRIRHAYGRSYPDLVRLRRGEIANPPDAVVRPRSRDALVAVVEAAHETRTGLIPFGGGTSVVGGVEAAPSSLPAQVSLDLTGLDRLLELDERSRVARFEAGIFGPVLERKLEAHGYSLGHFPQSFEYSTLGGWVAARSAGQNSSRYGKIEDMVEGLELVHPGGAWRIQSIPARASGPEWRELLVGSEGVLGVISEATVRIHPVPESTDYRAYLFRSFGAAVEATREMVQADVQPTILRATDAPYTEMAFHTLGGALQKAGAYVRGGLGVVGYGVPGASLMLLGFEGSDEQVRYQVQECARIVRRAGGLSLGHAPARGWRRERFEHPYLRDDYMDRGMLVDTLETATNWSNVPRLHRAVGTALDAACRDAGGASLVLAHVSHVYPEGASLYFTFMTRATQGEELARWREIKSAAGDAILAAGGTISHHHGVGMDHARWMAEERGPDAMAALAGLKRQLDPAGIMNPGKLGMDAGAPAKKDPAAKAPARKRSAGKAAARKRPARKTAAKRAPAKKAAAKKRPASKPSGK